MRLSSCEGDIRTLRCVFCWKINFHRWVGGWPVAGSTKNKVNLSLGLFCAGARAELGNRLCYIYYNVKTRLVALVSCFG